MNDLPAQILDVARSHTETAQAAWNARNREVQLLRGKISVLEQTLGQIRVENAVLRAKVRSMGGDLAEGSSDSGMGG